MERSSIDIPLHDIKPLVEVPDNSFYFLMGIIGVLLLVLLIGAYYLWRYITREKPRNLRKEALEVLKNIDFSDAKVSAYTMTKYGTFFSEDSPRHEEVFSNLNSRLSRYKYKENVEAIDNETIGYFNIYLGMCDV